MLRSQGRAYISDLWSHLESPRGRVRVSRTHGARTPTPTSYRRGSWRPGGGGVGTRGGSRCARAGGPDFRPPRRQSRVPKAHTREQPRARPPSAPPPPCAGTTQTPPRNPRNPAASSLRWDNADPAPNPAASVTAGRSPLPRARVTRWGKSPREECPVGWG